MKVLANSNPFILWEEIIHEAQASCETNLEKDIEGYLVMMLMRFMDKPEILQQIMATELLQTLLKPSLGRASTLQDVGDSCLIFSGLFPGIAEKRLVKISYFVNLGRGAYVSISQASNDIYSHLAKEFVSIMDVLQSIRNYAKDFPDLMPIQAYELWNDTGSKRALKALKKFTTGTPLATSTSTAPSIIKIK